MNCRNCSSCINKGCISCIERVSIFASLTPEEAIDVTSTITQRRYEKGENIYLEGDKAEKLFIVNEGRVKVVKLSESGKEQIIRVLGPGEFMGELSLFTHAPLNNNSEALETTTVCIIDGRQIETFIERRPSIALKILKEISIRLEKAENQIQALTIQDVEHRLANALLTMANDENLVNLAISKKDLASHMGMSRETLSRKLTSFEKQGWIKQEGQRKIKIINREALERVLGTK
ncbi:cAMP regulatory protein [Clostridium sp. N3C]|uniref:Crp/Fnr family transcriptional regulator n=1 Tax=Clostridium sp. N3C TaxID=1776758 RepID=UPI00092DFF57|nr:Crp/Fnr family transcriptional regulator [Clostridium sp. N3C]SCN21528.1 cAMP regulatory protein [Clostridium sp. N3C]